MATVRRLIEFAQQHGGRTRDEFLGLVRVPHLYFPCLPDLESAGSFTTIRIAPGGPNLDVGQQGLIAVEKDSASNAFGMMITMGRAQNNDLIVPDKRVSKFHAYFRQVGGAWTITDANSTNGTAVDGVMLEASQPHALHSGAELELSGSIPAQFLAPAEVYTLLDESRTRA